MGTWTRTYKSAVKQNSLICATYLEILLVYRKASYYFIGRGLEGMFWIMGSSPLLWVVTTSQKLIHKPVKFHLPAALIPSCLWKAFLGPQRSGGVKVLFHFQLESLPGQFVPILSLIIILCGRRGGKLSHNFKIYLNFPLSPRHLVERRQQCCRLVRCTNKNKIKLKKKPSKKSAILRKPPAFQLEHNQLLIWDSPRVNQQPRGEGAADLAVSHKPRPAPSGGNTQGREGGKGRVEGSHPQPTVETSPEGGRRSDGANQRGETPPGRRSLPDSGGAQPRSPRPPRRGSAPRPRAPAAGRQRGAAGLQQCSAGRPISVLPLGSGFPLPREQAPLLEPRSPGLGVIFRLFGFDLLPPLPPAGRPVSAPAAPRVGGQRAATCPRASPGHEEEQPAGL